MNILIINGPNLNMLGIREPDIYGSNTYQELVALVTEYANNNHCTVEIYQTNHEGEILDLLHSRYQEFDGLIINPGAFTHYSYAIYDCLKAIPLMAIEVHLSDLSTREPFRQISVIKDACKKQIHGKGIHSYFEAIDSFIRKD